jgi:hypothetical protein
VSNKIGVHATHCCKQHGCKYGDEDCPVVLGEVKQVYPCEECGNEHSDKAELIAEIEKLKKQPLGSASDIIHNHAIDDVIKLLRGG